jgi:opacity protein-like surface antigen
MVDRYLARASAALLFLVAAVGAGTAQAQNYEGPGLLRFGVFAQGTFLDFDVRAMPLGTATFVDEGTASLDGVGGGVSFGYDHRFSGGIVLGIEGDISLPGASTAFDGHDYGVDFLVTVRGRLGMFVHPHWLIYATAGYAALGVEYKGTTTVVAGTTPTKIDATLSGWTAGVGTELDLPQCIFFAEYLFTDFGTWGFTNATSDRYDIDVSGQVIRAGIKFKIGHEYRDGEPIQPR